MKRRHKGEKRTPKVLPPKKSSHRRRAFVPPPDHPRCPRNNKLRYNTMQSAENALKDSMLRGSNRQVSYRTYLCPHCDGWHLSSHPRREPY